MDIGSTAGASQAQNAGSLNKGLYADMFGAVKVSQGGMSWYELNRLGLLYTIGAQDVALVSLNAIATGLTATAIPIICLFNPIGSGVDLVLLKTTLALTSAGGTAVNPQGFHYITGSTANNPISTGAKNGGINCKSLLKVGSEATTMTDNNTALTGLVGSAVVIGPVGVPPVINATGPVTAVPLPQIISQDILEGQFIIKQGQFLGIMTKADVSAHASNVSSAFYWAELPTVLGS